MVGIVVVAVKGVVVVDSAECRVEVFGMEVRVEREGMARWMGVEQGWIEG